ncbi:MAG: adenosine-specific kinase [Candidatus Micrarchaeia archaeon]
MEIKSVKIEKDKGEQIIIGHAGFIKSAEDIYEALINSVPGIKFGVAFVEASGPCLVRSEGNENEMVARASKNALNIGAGHTFVILLKDAYPINVVNALKSVPEVVRIYCATANNVEVLIVNTGEGRAVLGVADGNAAKGIETIKDKKARRKFLRDIGYKLG